MFYHGRNVLVKINNEEIIASEATLNYEAQIAPYFEIDQRHANQITPENTILGSLNINYLYTGQDPIKKLIPLDSYINFDFGGICQKGYIRSYNARLSPHNPITCNTEIIFFRNPTGEFIPNYSNQDLEEKVVHINNAIISNENNEFVTGNYLSAEFSYNAEITPEIYIDSFEEERGVFGIKETSLVLRCDNLNPMLSISGKKVGVIFGVGPIGENITQGYAITGFLTRKNFQAKADDILTNELTIRQFSIIPEAEILGFTPLTGTRNSFITITGQNFTYVRNVYFGKFESNEFSIVDDNTIVARVPRMYKPLTERIRFLTLG